VAQEGSVRWLRASRPKMRTGSLPLKSVRVYGEKAFMKNMKINRLLLIVVCLLLAVRTSGQTKNAQTTTDQQFTTMADQIIVSELKPDIDAFERFLSDDCTIIHGDGKLLTKAEEVENLRSGARKYDVIERRQSNVRVYGETVVVTSLLSIKARVRGKPYTGDIRTTRVWVKKEGSWKTVALQVTRVSPTQ
jgi:hypothetical protein